MGFSTTQGSTMHMQGMPKIENFVPCDMNLWSTGGSTRADNQFSITLEVLKAPRASDLTRKREVAGNPIYFSVILYMYRLVTFMHLFF